MALKRPNQPEESEDPYPQTIITEGEFDRPYDRDLDHDGFSSWMTGNTPALLISGDVNAVDEHFDVRLESVGVHIKCSIPIF